MTVARARVRDRLGNLQAEIAAFNRARSWRQFHAPKNLVMAIAIEAAELMEPFRFLTARESWKEAREGKLAATVREELADVFILTIALADYLGIDLVEAARAKLVVNGEKYPVEASKGRRDKYTAYQNTAATRGEARRSAGTKATG